MTVHKLYTATRNCVNARRGAAGQQADSNGVPMPGSANSLIPTELLTKALLAGRDYLTA